MLIYYYIPVPLINYSIFIARRVLNLNYFFQFHILLLMQSLVPNDIHLIINILNKFGNREMSKMRN